MNLTNNGNGNSNKIVIFKISITGLIIALLFAAAWAISYIATREEIVDETTGVALSVSFADKRNASEISISPVVANGAMLASVSDAVGMPDGMVSVRSFEVFLTNASGVAQPLSRSATLSIPLTAEEQKHSYNVRVLRIEGDGAILASSTVGAERIIAEVDSLGVYAIAVVPYTVTYYSDNIPFAKTYCLHGETVTAPTAPERTGYNFSHYSNANGAVVNFSSFYINNDENLVASYIADTYELTLKAPDSSQITVRVTYDSTYSLPMEVLSKVGYEISSLNISGMPISNTGIWKYDLGGFADLNVSIIYTPKHYNIFGTEVVYGAPYQLQTPVKKGYDFVGFYYNEEVIPLSGQCWLYDIDSSDDVDSRWNRNTYSITFDSNGGTEVSAQSYLYGDKTSLPDVPSREGYDLVSWTFSRADFTLGDPMPAESIVATAQWAYKKVNYYSGDNGTTYKISDNDNNEPVLDYMDVSDLSVFFNEDYYLVFEIEMCMKEVDTGYQQIWLINEGSGIERGYAMLEYGGSPAVKEWGIVTFRFVISGETCTDVMRLRFGASGKYGDTWYRRWVVANISVAAK